MVAVEVLAVFAAFLDLTKAQFSNPPASGEAKDYSNLTTYTEGSVLHVSYHNYLTVDYDINLWQENTTEPEKVYRDLDDRGDILKYWTVTTKQDLSSTNIFYLSVLADDDSNTGFNSHYFIIQPNGSASASASPPGSSLTASSQISNSASAPGPSIANAPATTAPSAPAAQTSGSYGLTTSASVGIGVGVGIAGCLFIASIIGWFFLLRKRRSSGSAANSKRSLDPGRSLGNAGGSWPDTFKSELHADSAPNSGTYARPPGYEHKVMSDLKREASSGERHEMP